MTDADREQTGGDDAAQPSARVAAAAIRDAIEALEAERPDLARRLRELADELERPTGSG